MHICGNLAFLLAVPLLIKAAMNSGIIIVDVESCRTILTASNVGCRGSSVLILMVLMLPWCLV